MSQKGEFIYLSPPHMGGREQHFVQQAFDQNWITTAGANVNGFEQELASYTGVPAAAALASGTAALHLALLALGVGPGDEVLCSTFTFVASTNPIRYVGATPVLIESEATTWNLCPKALEAALQDRHKKGRIPKALMLVHLYGMPSRMKEIQELAQHYGVPIIEDAAEALGSRYHGRLLGTFGELGVFSFNGNKIITTSGGGALVSSDPTLVEQARWLAMQAKDDLPYYHHTTMGYNYRMSNISAGIGRGQLEVLEERVRQRRKVFANYQELLQEVTELEWHAEPEGFFSNRWLSCFTIKKGSSMTPEVLRQHLLTANIESRPLWQPMHRQPLYQSCDYFGDYVSDDLFARGLCLPSGSSLTPSDQERIADTIKKAFQG
ncbi:DegT/DnrJ/EryC1/StrS family aminotransferase [Rufibacter hautae]|uniref:Aminotransferase class I/II-fold pyridoxal phosphate-dependent enzyme n=1 Tax=Rufibacter hautae TaxID=2595005 RepID=A0A5B6TJR7_9BACT|nr:aminotransferase class I/II-fold pyridoxal phosphate-dependent enzyme [Rufibacter hautae]KAA3439639.1 aminotransferase class I/II-fold pyridoxal phosphate-dependent enzyme [Rufibacter hautae]